jgi:hypothetical protein
MKDLNSWETTLRQWKPRRPSADLEARIFAVEIDESIGRLDWHDAWRWFVPALGCFILAIASLNPHPAGFHGGSATNNPFRDFNLGSLKVANYSPAESHSELNSVPKTKIESTFGTEAGSSTASFRSSDTDTNTLKP